MNPLNYMRLHDYSSRNSRQHWINASNGKIRHMREILDPVSPKWLRPVFTSVCRQLQRGKALEAMMFLDGHYVLARDGTGYLSSQTIHCASCLHTVHRHGSITYDHQMLGAAMIHPAR